MRPRPYGGTQYLPDWPLGGSRRVRSPSVLVGGPRPKSQVRLRLNRIARRRRCLLKMGLRVPIGNIWIGWRATPEISSRSGIYGQISTTRGNLFPIGNSDVTSEQIGAIIRKSRLDQGLRQDQLAAAAAVGLRFLIELEAGKPTVRLDKVLAVLDALGCRLDIILPPTSPATSRRD